mmetsp:Transcript_14876/g.51098  ORF Transcript_14876/g.51098 Transcript_14876/m.51098 type:complete len:212 (+) Transcript_14876:97-732(+)
MRSVVLSDASQSTSSATHAAAHASTASRCSASGLSVLRAALASPASLSALARAFWAGDGAAHDASSPSSSSTRLATGANVSASEIPGCPMRAAVPRITAASRCAPCRPSDAAVLRSACAARSSLGYVCGGLNPCLGTSLCSTDDMLRPSHRQNLNLSSIATRKISPSCLLLALNPSSSAASIIAPASRSASATYSLASASLSALLSSTTDP